MSGRRLRHSVSDVFPEAGNFSGAVFPCKNSFPPGEPVAIIRDDVYSFLQEVIFMKKAVMLLALTAVLSDPVLADALTDAVDNAIKEQAKTQVKNQAASALKGTGADKIVSGIDQVNSGMSQLKKAGSLAEQGGKSLTDTAKDKAVDYAKEQAVQYVKDKAGSSQNTPDSVKQALEGKQKYDKAKNSAETLKNNTEQAVKAADDLINAFK
jgi:hypothetical protein